MVTTAVSLAVAGPCRRVARRRPATPVTASAGAADTSSRRAAVLALGAGLLGAYSLAACRAGQPGGPAAFREAGSVKGSPPGATHRGRHLGAAPCHRLRLICAWWEAGTDVVPPSPAGVHHTLKVAATTRLVAPLLTRPALLPSPTSREAERCPRRGGGRTCCCAAAAAHQRGVRV